MSRLMVRSRLVRGLIGCSLAIASLAPASEVHAAGFPTIDAQFSGVGAIGARGVLNLNVLGRGGVPASGVDAVAVNVTATDATASSYLTVWPTGSPMPTASNLNFDAGQSIPNMVIAKVGVNGQISLYNQAGSVDVIVDVLGWFPTGGAFTSLSPARLLESRAGLSTIDGQFAGIGSIGDRGTLNLTVLGRGGVPASGVDAVAVNVTATDATASSYLTVWPTGSPIPTASNLNFGAGQTIPNMVIAKVGVNGQISLFNQAGSVDVIVDVLGWFPTGGAFTSVSPARLLESRAGQPTIDGQFAGVGSISTGGVLNLSVLGRGGVASAGVGAVAINVTATGATGPSFLTVWPAATSMPTASNLNFGAGQTIPNMVIAKVGVNGQISMFNQAGNVDVIVDVLGWFPAGAAYTGLTPARLMDSRIVLPTPAPPAPAPPTPGVGSPGTGSCTGGYINVNGNCIPSPVSAPSAPAGATAQCRDGTYSFSQNRSGTCSHHGGVARWL